MVYFAQIAALALGVLIGSQLPDVDVWLFFLKGSHRSILTHSPLIPYGLYLAAQGRSTTWRWGALGLGAAVAGHLAFDVFPKAGWGTGLLNAPLLGRIDPTLSLLILIASVVICWYLALLLAEKRDRALVLLAGFIGFVIEAIRTQEPWFLPLLALAAGLFLASLLPNTALNGRQLARDAAEKIRSWRSAP